MAAQRLAFVALAAALAVPGLAVAEEGLAPGVAQLYRDVVHALDGDPSHGAEGVLRALLHPSLNASGLWQLQRDAHEQVSPSTAQQVLADAPQAVPRAPQELPLAVVGTGRASPDPAVDPAVLDALPWPDAQASAEDALASLPVDPREVALRLAAELGSFSLPKLPDGAKPTSEAADERATPHDPGEGRGPYASALAAPLAPELHEGLASGREQVLAAPFEDLLPAPPARAARPAAAPWEAALEQPAPFAAVALIFLLTSPFLYHRLQRSALLDHALRGRLFLLVQQRPGIHIEELAREAGCSRSTAVYHLRLLARHEHLVAMQGRKSVHYYPNNGKGEEHERAQRALLTGPRTRQLAAFIAAQPGLARGDLARSAGIAPSTLSWHLGRLLEAGLVEERIAPAGTRALFPSPVLPSLLRPWESGPAPLPAEAAPGVAPGVVPGVAGPVTVLPFA